MAYACTQTFDAAIFGNVDSGILNDVVFGRMTSELRRHGCHIKTALWRSDPLWRVEGDDGSHLMPWAEVIMYRRADLNHPDAYRVHVSALSRRDA